jgi:hypothetical protein
VGSAAPIQSQEAAVNTDYKFYRIGTKVICNGEPAKVLRIQIGTFGVMYEVGYWLRGEWKEVWLPESEVEEEKAEKRQPGF